MHLWVKNYIYLKISRLHTNIRVYPLENRKHLVTKQKEDKKNSFKKTCLETILEPFFIFI